jgi:hypothetical protein
MFGENNGVDLNAQQLLAIGTLVNSPGRVKKGKVTYVPDTTAVSNGVPLPILIHDRIESLRFKRDIFGDGNSPRSIFTFLDQWAVRETGARKQAVSLQNALLSLGARAANSENEGKLDPTITASIGIEVIGAEWHERVLDYADKASRREARVDEFSRRLAGLAQNVFDFRRQDVEEVNDSLSSAVRIGNDITFAQREVAIRFIEESRAFSEMRCILGGSPYWLLVQLVLGHNERLLSHLNKEFETTVSAAMTTQDLGLSCL